MEGAAAGSSEPVAIYVELSAAVAALRARGLAQSVKWAAEQLVGLPESAWEPGAAQAAEAAARAVEPEHPRLVQGRCLFELKEYTRAAHALAGLGGPVALFLRCYALFLAGEKQKEQERVEAAGPLGSAAVTNPHLGVVGAELEAAEAAGLGDAFTAYLAALLAIERGHKSEARRLLVASLNAFPCHWGAWQALVGLCDELSELSSLGLAQHWAAGFFAAALCLELQANAEALSRLQLINQLFPGSDWVAGAAAQAHYSARNFGAAAALYEDLLARDPWRLQGMDTYSNILFVTDDAPRLAHLAHRLAVSDKFTPEAGCVIGNYYSLKGQHERAVAWFRRALRLCPAYLSAWTLMGHEYVELKNAPAAIDAYRSAVALNPRDYRAWYGLGQTYELLGAVHYALTYYRRAALLRPTDPRMWCALGHCYEAEGLAMPGLALRCYRRAVAHGDREGIGLAKLAKLHEAQGERGAAAHYHALNLARLEAEGGSCGPDATEALTFLAEYAKDCGMLAEAEGYCQRLLDAGGPANVRAKAILRDMRSSSSSCSGAAAAAAAAGGAGAGGSARPVLGARRALGDAAGGGGSGQPWVTSALGQPPPPGSGAMEPGEQQPQPTPGGLSVVMDTEGGSSYGGDEDEERELLTGAANAAPGATPGSSAPPRPFGLRGADGPTPAPTPPNFGWLLRPAFQQQPLQQQQGQDAAGAGGHGIITPATAGGPSGRGAVATRLFATPPTADGGGGDAAALAQLLAANGGGASGGAEPRGDDLLQRALAALERRQGG